MALYTIADLHLSTHDTTDKSMEVFGRRWDGYMTRIKNNWERLVTNEDTVVIPGDVSWALSLEEAVSDLKFIDSLPGRKILLQHNLQTYSREQLVLEPLGWCVLEGR